LLIKSKTNKPAHIKHYDPLNKFGALNIQGFSSVLIQQQKRMFNIQIINS
jgi:hypothetical protein